MGDDVFAIKLWLQKFYLRPTGGQEERLIHVQKVFNYRLSKERRIVENAVGILSQLWSIIKNGIQLSCNKARGLVFCCVVLLNLMMKDFPELQDVKMDGPEDDHDNIWPGLWEQDAGDVWNVAANYHGKSNARGEELRDYLAD